MKSDATTLSEDEVDSMADAGMLVTLDLDEDGNLIYNEVGNQQDGSWSVTDEATLSFELGGSKIDVPYDDDLLTLEASGTTMVFEKASDEPNMDASPRTTLVRLPRRWSMTRLTSMTLTMATPTSMSTTSPTCSPMT